MRFIDMLGDYLYENKVEPNISFLNLNFTDTIVISGKKDSGKSYFANLLMKSISRYVLWDMRLERVHKDTIVKSKKAILITDKDIKITSDVRDIGKFNKIIFHPVVSNKKQLLTLFDTVCQKVRQLQNYILIVEEADSVIPFQQTMVDGIFELTQGNIHNNVGLIFITRRLQRLNVDAVRLADHFFMFQFSEKDKEYLVSMGAKEEDLKPLQKRQFYHFNGNEVKFYTTEGKK